MSDEREAVPMTSISKSAKELILLVGEIQSRWVKGRKVTTGLEERLAVYVCYRTLVRAFTLEGVVEDPEAVLALNALADDIDVKTGPAPEPMTRAQA